jgi:hypothetical protein
VESIRGGVGTDGKSSCDLGSIDMNDLLEKKSSVYKST